jgi:hypothetical protein
MYKYSLYPLLLIIGLFTPLQSFSGVDFQTTLNQLSEKSFSKKLKQLKLLLVVRIQELNLFLSRYLKVEFITLKIPRKLFLD